METTLNRSRHERARERLGVLARMLDVTLIVSSAIAVSMPLSCDAEHCVVRWAFAAFSITFALILFPVFGVYRSWRGRSKLRLASHIGFAWALAQACALASMFALHRTTYISCLWWVLWAFTAGFGLIASRLIAHAVLARVRVTGRDLRKVAIVGAGECCARVVRRIDETPVSGFRAVAIFDVEVHPATCNPDLSVYRDLARFSAHVRAENIQEVWLALPMSEQCMVLRVLDEFSRDLVNVRFIPDVPGIAILGGETIDLIGVPAINLMASPMSSMELLQKAIFDRLFAAVALIALAPLIVVIAAAVKLSSKGPVLFTQQRKGADGRIFSIFKFRTMHEHVEQDGVVRQATRNDPRVTRVGRLLRRTSLDELPQFFNVLRGEMSVVGPRPHAVEHDHLYQGVVAGYIHRYRTKPGITGWAQVNGLRGETDHIEKMAKRVDFDLYYIRNWTFLFDLKIIFLTIFMGFTGATAY
ncbi:undecaprenyl-phosphate glucose phosphotransferase [Paraburkholderia sp. IMGN_8]|uniref:undecaprenyl-phosphate glucose phosphotransferase n=1 Tax=Paraburkholderia sp. IMGN_8 TaxID=3136564 RepID=UPI003100E14A